MREKVYYQDGKIDLRLENSSWSYMVGFVGDSAAVVLDVGCACGDLGLALKKSRNAEIYGLEYNEGSIEVALATGVYEKIVQCDLDLLKEGNFCEWNGKFDYLICGDIFEHLRDPANVLKNLARFLKSNGKLIASIPNVAHMYIKAQLLTDRFEYTETGLLDETHIHLFTRHSISEFMSTCGFAIHECRFTMCGKNEWHEYDPWVKLSYFEKDSIFTDWHSYVCQYVFVAGKSEIEADELFRRNLGKLNINEDNAPQYILDYKHQMGADIGVSPLVTLAADRDRILADRNALAADRNLLVADRDRILADRDRILNSTCWKITAPLRYLMDRIKRFMKKS